MSPQRGFTLAEMLIVVAVLAILGTVTLVALNPSQLLAQQRDSNRMSDMSSLSIAIQDYASVVGGSLGSSNTLYVSIPDPAATSTAGDQCQGLGLPALTGYAYHCAASSTYKNIDGTGWIPVNFRAIGSVLPISSLTVDPTNTTSSHLYYMYATNGEKFEVTAAMESSKYKLGGASDAIAGDGGPLASVYEKGTQFGLEPLDYGDSSLVAYYPMDEGTGTIVLDASGNGRDGTWSGAMPYYTAAKVGAYAGSFASSNETISIPSGPTYGTNFSIIAWEKTSSVGWKWLVTRSGGSWFGENSLGDLDWSRAAGNDYVSRGYIADGNWHLTAMTFNNGSLNLYVDGNNVGTWSGVTLTVTTGGLFVGQRGDGVEYFNGSIDDVRVYGRALSAGEIQALYNATK